ncbi:unnamed protein product [Brassicogethes aeneus]|uniref:Uncharacterized protein n=1 Tax=Brassicogethes aeneus TaxID=1431903 RepID=A0A9P0B054_BRAAE|nr:unnamed protein product [Brassicogethes aeneus]
MAGNEGTSAELFPGWSSVVHQPCEEPEESELPSTVDMAAFSSELNVPPANASQINAKSDSDSDSEADSSNSGSEASQSCSQSDSSDSDSSTSSQESSSRSPSPEFSVTSSQTNGLRLTIATVRKPGSPSSEKVMEKSCKSASSSSGSPASSDSDSDSDTSKSDLPVTKSVVKNVKDNQKKPVSKVRTKVVDKKDEKKVGKKESSSSPVKGATTRGKAKKRTKKLPFGIVFIGRVARVAVTASGFCFVVCVVRNMVRHVEYLATSDNGDLAEGVWEYVNNLVKNYRTRETQQNEHYQFFLANGIKEDQRKRAILLNSMTDDTFILLRNLCVPDAPEKMTSEKLMESLSKHCTPVESYFTVRLKFYGAKRGDEENVADWAARVRSLASGCKFGDEFKIVSRDIFVAGIGSGPIMDRLMEENATSDKATWEHMLKLALSKEAVLKEKKKTLETSSSEVLKMSGSRNKFRFIKLRTDLNIEPNNKQNNEPNGKQNGKWRFLISTIRTTNGTFVLFP